VCPSKIVSLKGCSRGFCAHFAPKNPAQGIGRNRITKVETVCPYFKKQIVVERNHFGVGEHALSLQDKQPGRIARPGALPGWMELMTKINALVANCTAAARQTRFNPQGVEKDDLVAVNRETC
jgi:hypothetical protein